MKDVLRASNEVSPIKNLSPRLFVKDKSFKGDHKASVLNHNKKGISNGVKILTINCGSSSIKYQVYIFPSGELLGEG